MKNIISRPFRAALPLGLACCAAFMPGAAGRAAELMAALVLARLCSLCAGTAFRIAAGSVVNSARLRGNFLTSLVVTCAGSLAAVALSMAELPFLPGIGLFYALAGAFINIAQLCSDRLYAAYDSFSPPLFDLIIAFLAAAGLLISAVDVWLMPAVMLPAVIAGIMLLVGLRSGRRIKPGFGIFRCIPSALLTGFAFQAILTAYMAYASVSPHAAAAILVAISIVEWCGSPFRRNDTEGAALTVSAVLISSAAALCSLLLPAVPGSYASLTAFAFSGVLFTGLQLTPRRMVFIAGTIFLAELCLQPASTIMLILCAVICAVMIICLFPDVLSIKRHLRARRLRRRRAR